MNTGMSLREKVCEEKSRLLKTYQQVTEKYAAVVTELHRRMGTLSKAEYDSIYATSESLHADVTRAQGELNSHVVAHRC